MRAAAAITSMTMNGGTSLRREGLQQPLWPFSSMAIPAVLRPAPLLPYSAWLRCRIDGLRFQTQT